MKILGLFLNNELRTGGHRRLLELLEDLAARGNETIAILNEKLAYEPRFFTAARVPCAYRRNSLIPISVSFRAAVCRSRANIEKACEGAEAIMIHGETHLAAAREIKRLTGTPILYAHRSNSVRDAEIALADSSLSVTDRLKTSRVKFFAGRYERILTRNADLLVFQSPFDRDDFVARNPSAADKTEVIRGNIAPPRFLPETEGINKSESLKRLVFLGTLGPRKGVRHLFTAMELLDRRGIKNLELDVLGPGETKEYWVNWLRERNLSGRVRVHGRVKDPFPFIADADLMVIPSDFDSYPDTILESLHVGTPVIASETGGIPDMLGRADLLFPVQDPQAIADKIERFYADVPYYQEVRAYCARRREFFHFDWAAEWERAFARILNI